MAAAAPAAVPRSRDGRDSFGDSSPTHSVIPMAEPFASIIIRSFNEGWALRETLPAIRAQDYPHWELIVIDSGSTDDSVA